MKILIINGSARSGGGYSYNISKKLRDTLLKIFPTTEVNIFNIANQKIAPCIGCIQCCNQSEKYCILKDDIYQAYRLMEECDSIVFASPIYECFISGVLKNFFDRTNHYTSFFKLAGKPLNLILSDVQPIHGKTKEFSNKHVVKNINQYFKNYSIITHTYYNFLGFIQHLDHHSTTLEDNVETNKMFLRMAKALLKQRINKKLKNKSTTPYAV